MSVGRRRKRASFKAEIAALRVDVATAVLVGDIDHARAARYVSPKSRNQIAFAHIDLAKDKSRASL